MYECYLSTSKNLNITYSSIQFLNKVFKFRMSFLLIRIRYNFFENTMFSFYQRKIAIYCHGQLKSSIVGSIDFDKNRYYYEMSLAIYGRRAWIFCYYLCEKLLN